MKLSFSLKKKEVKLEADVEGIVEKSLDHREKTGPKKPRYQIKQEEKRKNKELKHKLEQKRMITGVLIMLGVIVVVLVICLIGNSIN